jgi:hypothetical protein
MDMQMTLRNSSEELILLSTETFEQRFKRVFREFRSLGVAARINVYECCRGCITPEKLNMKDDKQPYVYNYAGQENAIKFSGDSVTYRHNGRPVSRIYVNHGNDIARQFTQMCESHGIETEWSGDDSDCVEVIIP